MAAYVKPQPAVYQEFVIAPSLITQNLRPVIIGPDYQLVRYSEAGEKALGLLGAYVPDDETCYSWPNREAGAVVDQDATRVFIDDALLQYFSSASVSGASIEASFCDPTYGGYKNRIRANFNWAANGSSYPRVSALLNRDVKVGDTILIQGSVDGSVVEHLTYVSGLIYDQTASVIDAPEADAVNQVASTASASAAQTAGEENNVDIASASAASYDGLADGDVSEVYTIEVLTGGDPSDSGNLPLLKVTSASGNDDDLAVVPEVFDTPTSIGSRGLTVIFSTSSGSSSSPGADQSVFVAGQTWEVTVTGAFTVSAASASGTYTGPSDTIYIVEVVTGGLWSNSPKIQVSTNTGIDASSGLHTLQPAVEGDDSLGSAAVAIGNYGVSISFDESGLVKGDRFYISATAAANAAVKTLSLGKNLPAGLLGLDEDGDCDTAPSLTVTLYIKKNIEVSENRTGYAPVVNFRTNATQVCLNSGILAYDSSWTDAGGEMAALPVKGGTAYAEYRAFRQEYVRSVNSIQDVGDAADAFAALDSGNPLAYGVQKALANANGATVLFVAVADNSIESWARAAGLLEQRSDTYAIAPMTFDRAVRDLFQAHAESMSGPLVGRWRRIYGVGEAASDKQILAASGSPLLATISDDPEADGTQYTFVEATNTTSALNFTDAGVKAGDILRISYRTDGFGVATYSEYAIDAVLSDDSVRLVDGPDVPSSVASRFEVWRTLSAADIAQEVATDSGSFGSSRMVNIWPDYIDAAGETVPGYYLGAAIAGAVGGVVPQQGLTNVEISGFDAVPRTTDTFTEDQLDTMGAAGTWIVTQDPATGKIYTRHALTTDMSLLEKREEAIGRNFDAISFTCLNTIAPYTGVANITPSLIAEVETNLKDILEYLSSPGTATSTLGPQIISYEILEIAQHPVLKDRLVMRVKPELPYPLNDPELHLIVGGTA